jgi:alpha-1,3-glucan synthase
VSSTTRDGVETVPIEFHFSATMNCDGLTKKLQITSITESGKKATIDKSSIVCSTSNAHDVPPFVGAIPTTWTYKAKLTNVANGIHELVLKDVDTKDGRNSTNV